jgi:hypothetical protein
MVIDEPLDVMLRQLQEDAKLGDNDFRAAIISGLLSRFPVAGAVIDNHSGKRLPGMLTGGSCNCSRRCGSD